MPPRSLHATLLLVLQGCCGSDPEYFDEVMRDDHDGMIAGAALQEIREQYPSDDERCEAACLHVAAESDEGGGEVVECRASELGQRDPWSADVTAVTISCTTSSQERVARPPTCGRRPHALQDVAIAIDSRADWLAAVAHLEAASVVAFEHLARALALHGAPAELVARCHAAADDERVHAALMGALARREGACVPAMRTDPSPTDLLAVALHNATEGCVHEAFAAILAAHQARHAPDALRAAFVRIADDECVHGQLAWDVHAWLVGRLSASERLAVAIARRRALARLPVVAREQAAQTPSGLGWPTPARAIAMAERFAMLASA